MLNVKGSFFIEKNDISNNFNYVDKNNVNDKSTNYKNNYKNNNNKNDNYNNSYNDFNNDNNNDNNNYKDNENSREYDFSIMSSMNSFEGEYHMK